MGVLIGIFIITTVVLLSINLYYQSKHATRQYFISIGLIGLSLVLIIIAYIFNLWDMIGLGTIGLTLFISSGTSLIITALIGNMRDLKIAYWDDE